MKYPNIKPQNGEQKDINQRRYPDDNIEIAVDHSTPESTSRGFDDEAPAEWDTDDISPENQPLEARDA